MEKIKLLALDMDGTTLNSEHRISETNKAAIQKAIDSGILVVPASGRSLPSLPKDLQGLDLPYAITKNGSVINDLKDNGREIYHQTIDRRLALKILRLIEEKHCFVRFDYSATTYGSAVHFEEIKKEVPGYAKFEDCLYPSLVELLENNDLKIDKISATALDQETFEDLLALQSKIIQLNIMSSGYPFVEINARMTSKGYALKQLAQILNISAENVAAIGDNDNDLIMLCYAGYSFAMGNGSKVARQTAKEITLSNDEDGVAFAIEKILQRNKDIE